MSTVNPLEHTAIGGLSGLMEVIIMQPTVGIKNALQEGRPVPRSPFQLYRGLAVRANIEIDCELYHGFGTLSQLSLDAEPGCQVSFEDLLLRR